MADRVSIVAVSIAAFLTTINQISIIITAKQLWMQQQQLQQQLERASSKRMAFLKFDKKFKECGVRYNSSRERIFIKLVGVPVSKEDFQARFPKRTEEDLPIEPEM